MQTRSIGRAAAWMAGWLAATLLMTIAGRELARELPVFLLMLLRSAIAVGCLIPFVLWQGGRPLRTYRLGTHVGRNVVHYSAQYCWFFALSLIPMARVISIEFTLPIWVAVLASLFLGERLSAIRLAAIAAGFAGILVIVRPGMGNVGIGELAALYAAMMFAGSVTITRSLMRTESALTVIFYMFALQTVFGLLPALAVWTWPAPHHWPWIVAIGTVGTFSHFCLAKAIGAAEATVVAPMDFLRVPLTALAGFLLYDEQVDAFLVVGAGLILAGNLLNLRQEKER